MIIWLVLRKAIKWSRFYGLYQGCLKWCPSPLPTLPLAPARHTTPARLSFNVKCENRAAGPRPVSSFPFVAVCVQIIFNLTNKYFSAPGLYSQSYLHPPKVSLLPPPEVTRIRCLVSQDKPKPKPLQRRTSFLQKLRGKEGKKEEPLRNESYSRE